MACGSTRERPVAGAGCAASSRRRISATVPGGGSTELLRWAAEPCPESRTAVAGATPDAGGAGCGRPRPGEGSTTAGGGPGSALPARTGRGERRSRAPRICSCTSESCRTSAPARSNSSENAPLDAGVEEDPLVSSCGERAGAPDGDVARRVALSPRSTERGARGVSASATSVLSERCRACSNPSRPSACAPRGVPAFLPSPLSSSSFVTRPSTRSTAAVSAGVLTNEELGGSPEKSRMFATRIQSF